MRYRELVHYELCAEGDYAGELYRVEDEDAGVFFEVVMVEMVSCRSEPCRMRSFSLSPQRNERTLRRLWYQVVGGMLPDSVFEEVGAAGSAGQESGDA